MSRVERHRKRREGDITGVGKAVEEELNLDEGFDINPIINKPKEEEARRQKTYEVPTFVGQMKNNEEIKTSPTGRKELFDIEEAFNQLRSENKDYDHDTQLEIMTELFSSEGDDYKEAADFSIDGDTNKIMITKEDLEKILDHREKKMKAKNKKASLKRKVTKPVVSEIVEEDTEPFLKEELGINEFVKIEQEDLIKNRIPKDALSNDGSSLDDFKLKGDKLSIVLIIVVIILALVLGFLVFKFISN
ncbi:MAG: hypothetical protein RR425_05405 [Erysipelotrichales bacterium]